MALEPRAWSVDMNRSADHQDHVSPKSLHVHPPSLPLWRWQHHKWKEAECPSHHLEGKAKDSTQPTSACEMSEKYTFVLLSRTVLYVFLRAVLSHWFVSLPLPREHCLNYCNFRRSLKSDRTKSKRKTGMNFPVTRQFFVYFRGLVSAFVEWINEAKRGS